MKLSQVIAKASRHYYGHVLEHRYDPVNLYRAHTNALEHALQSLKTDSKK